MKHQPMGTFTWMMEKPLITSTKEEYTLVEFTFKDNKFQMTAHNSKFNREDGSIPSS
jgi:hypothetical protein